MAFIDVEILSSAARTAAGATNAFTVGRAESVLLYIDITAISGTLPRIGFQVKFAGTTGGAYATAKTIVRATAVGSLAVRVPVQGKYLKVAYDIYGTTPSVTFTIRGAWIERV